MHQAFCVKGTTATAVRAEDLQAMGGVGLETIVLAEARRNSNQLRPHLSHNPIDKFLSPKCPRHFCEIVCHLTHLSRRG